VQTAAGWVFAAAAFFSLAAAPLCAEALWGEALLETEALVSQVFAVMAAAAELFAAKAAKAAGEVRVSAFFPIRRDAQAAKAVAEVR
jgi:hypothetical protein